MKAMEDMTNQEAQAHLDDHHDADMEMKFRKAPIRWDARQRRCWLEYHYWVHRTKPQDHTHEEPNGHKGKPTRRAAERGTAADARGARRLQPAGSVRAGASGGDDLSGLRSPIQDRGGVVTKDLEPPKPFRLEDYPGLEVAVAAMMEAVAAGKAATPRYVNAAKAAMDALAGAGWKYKPAKKIRPDKLSKSELVWQELDSVMERLMSDEASERDQGEAYGLALALAIMKDPHEIDVDSIRDEAVRRWEES